MKKTIPLLFKTGLVSLSLTVLLSCGPQTSEEYIAEAQKYLKEDNSAAAIVALKNAVQAEPKSADARFELGQLYLASKQYESAEKELNRAFEYGYSPAKVLPLLTKAYQYTGAYSALSKLQHEEEGLTAAERAEIGYFKVVSLVRLEKADEAKKLIAELANIDTNSTFKGLTAVYGKILETKLDEALQDVAALREYSPQDAEVLKLLAQLQLSQNQREEAARTFKQYVQFYPDDKQIKFVLAKLLVDINKTEEAEPYIDDLLKISQENPLLNQLKAAARAVQRDFVNALKYAEVAILSGSNEPSVYLIAGYSAYQIGDYTAASRNLSNVASSLADNHPALKLLAASQLQLGLTNEASEVLNRIDELNQTDAPLLSKAGYQLLREGYEKEAKHIVELASDLSVTAEDLTRLGLLKLSLNDVDGIVNLEEAVEKSPEFVSAQTTLATAYMAAGQYDKALELAKSWKLVDANDLKAYMLASQIYIKRKDFAQAEAEIKQAIVIEPNSPEPQLALVNLDLMQAKFPQATEKLENLLKKEPDYVPALATNYLLQKQSGEGVKALERVKAALADKPKDVQLRMLLARLNLAEMRYADALSVLEGLKGQSDLPRSYWKVKGQSLIASNQRLAAEKHYDEWLQMYPNDKEATFGRLLLLDSENKFAEGVAMTQSFLDKRDDVQMQMLNAHFIIMSGDWVKGKQAYDNLPSEAQKLPLVKGLQARLQVHNQQFAEALDNAKVAYKGSENYRNAAMLTFIYEKLGQSAAAFQFLEQHIADHPDDMTSRMLLAERQISGDVQSAMASYEIAIQENPKNYIAFNNLAYLNLQKGQLQKAKEYGQKAVELKPTDPATVDTLAQILVAEKAYDKALKLYERVVDDKLKIDEVYLNYVETLFMAKQDILAKRKITQREFSDPVSLERVASLKNKYQF